MSAIEALVREALIQSLRNEVSRRRAREKFIQNLADEVSRRNAGAAALGGFLGGAAPEALMAPPLRPEDSATMITPNDNVSA